MGVMLPKEFGDGWMTTSARDLAKIAVNVAGFDTKKLVRRLALYKNRGRMINSRTVERILGELSTEAKRLADRQDFPRR